MTEFSLRQYTADDVNKANSLLKQIQQLDHMIHLSVNNDNKRLKKPRFCCTTPLSGLLSCCAQATSKIGRVRL